MVDTRIYVLQKLLSLGLNYKINQSFIMWSCIRVTLSVVGLTVAEDVNMDVNGVCLIDRDPFVNSSSNKLPEELPQLKSFCDVNKPVSQVWDWKYCFNDNVVENHRSGKMVSPECCQMWGIIWHHDYVAYKYHLTHGQGHIVDVRFYLDYYVGANPDLLPAWHRRSGIRSVTLYGMNTFQRMFDDWRNIIDSQPNSVNLVDDNDEKELEDKISD